MSAWPETVEFRDPTSGETATVTLPKTREEAKLVVAEIRRLFEAGKQAEFRRMGRMYTQCDLYVLGLLSSAADRDDPYTGRPEIDHDFIFKNFREIQFNSIGVIDYSFRGGWKTTIKLFLKTIQDLMRDPNEAIAFMSHEKGSAEDNVGRVLRELEQNEIIKAMWAPDVFWKDPNDRSTVKQWSASDGATIPGRRIPAAKPSIGAYTYVGKLPVGSRFSRIKFDDCETEETAESEILTDKIKRRFPQAMNLLGRSPLVEMNGTIFIANGLIHSLLQKGWPGRCFPAEDVNQEPPDIAAIYDELGGVDPSNGEKMPPEVREIKLAGAPVFWHPIECAIKRWRQGDALYNQQNMGDAQAGLVRSFLADWFRYYEAIPEDRAKNQNSYIVIDPSRGESDPSVAFVVVAHSNESVSVVDGFRKRLTPTELNQEVYFLAAKWRELTKIQEIRVEEYGQATFSIFMADHFHRYKLDVPDPIRCTQTRINRDHQRDWVRLEPPFRQGRVYFPRDGLRCEDEKGRVFDLIEHFIHKELLPFPGVESDDCLAAFSLLWDTSQAPIYWTEQRERERDMAIDKLSELDEFQRGGSWAMGAFR